MWILLALAAAILWGLNYSLAEKVLQHISATTLIALEMLTGSLLFCTIAGMTTFKKDFNLLINNTKIFWLTLAEVMIVILASYLIMLSIRAKNATAAGVIELIYPLFTIFFTWLLFRENHINASVIIGGLLIAIGVFIISHA
jgi:drug/metabolite transporter (DMT)-like permease